MLWFTLAKGIDACCFVAGTMNVFCKVTMLALGEHEQAPIHTNTYTINVLPLRFGAVKLDRHHLTAAAT